MFMKEINNSTATITLELQKKEKVNIKCWDIFMADIPRELGSRKQSGLRPVLIYCNQKCLDYSDYITIIPFTTKVKRLMSTHLYFNRMLCDKVGLKNESVLTCEQINGLDTKHLMYKVGHIADKTIQFSIVRKALMQSLGDYNLNFITDEFLEHNYA